MIPEDKQSQFLRAYLPVHARLDRYVRSMTRDADDARDAVGDTVLEAYEQFEGIRDTAAFLSFIFTIARRTLSRMRWRRRLFHHQDDETMEQFASVLQSPETAAEIRLLHDALRRLPRAQREALVLHELSDLPLERVAEIQHASLSAVKQRVRRARLHLKDLLGVDAHDAERSHLHSRGTFSSIVVPAEEGHE